MSALPATAKNLTYGFKRSLTAFLTDVYIKILCLKKILPSIVNLVIDRVPAVGFSGIRNQPKNYFKRQVEHKTFLQFFLSTFWHNIL